ncbi:MAG: S8 family serine peptidase [Bacilli bacterium]
MKLWHRLIITFTLFIFLAWWIIFPNSSNENNLNIPFLNYELLLEIEETEASQIAQTNHIELYDYSQYGFATYKIPNEEQYYALLADESYEFIPNSIATTDAPPSKLKEDLTNLYALSLMDTYDAWQLTLGNANVVVAIIDTGIDIYHNEFIGKISTISYNSKSKTVGLSQVIDDQGHGTMVAGVIAATKGNNIGIAGIAPSSTLLVIKANEPNEGSFLDSSVIEGIYYAADHGADIINMSLGSPYANPLTKAALEYARSKGVLIVAASGNDSVSTPYYPASFDTTISVSAIDQTKLLASYSNYGPNISVSAPGTNIYTTVKGNTYGYGSGTSLAAPQVSGVLALMSAYLTISDEEIMERLLLTSSDLGLLGKDDAYGYGLVNSYDALVHPLVTISFETFGGTVLQPIKVAAGRPFVCSQIPEKGLSVFSGWYQDRLFTNPWIEGTSVANNNLTLYAKYTQSFYLVAFVTAGTTPNDIIVAANGTFTLPTTTLDQYQFVGWFLDSQYLEPYVLGPVNSDLTLYAKFEKLDTYYNIIFVTSGSAISPIKLKEGESFIPPISYLEGHTFQGWFIDSNYTIKYQNEPIMQSLTLYAYFTVNDYQITYWVDNILYDSVVLPYGSTIILPTPTKLGYNFSGWFLDNHYTIPFDEQEILESTSLYGQFTIKTFEVVFMVDDSIISKQTISYLNNAITPNPPTKPDSTSFSYEFWGWSASYESVTSDLVIKALFTKTFKPQSVFLNPGIDTIYQGNEWIDAGITYDEEALTYNVISQVNIDQIERYVVTYLLYDETTLVYEKNRIVSVVEKPVQVQITLNDDVTTIKEGQAFVDKGATTTLGTITAIGEVDNRKAGIYVITYQVVYQNITYAKHKYVYVLEEADLQQPIAMILNDKKRWLT